ncbi:MAG: GNAT family N-acetyltransferase [Betaproteobacteria bacterium]|nr:GNAT family N-acetyltransferase [Betaproteobacteria bacterium]
MSVSLRDAKPANAECIAEVILASRGAFLAFAASAHTDDEIRTWVRNVLLPSEEVTVAVAKRRIVGVIAIERAEGASWLTQLYLHPSYVAQGIGSTLLAHTLATAPFPIRLYTFQQNAGARRFYERNGFVPIQCTDGSANEERCPDVPYELTAPARARAVDAHSVRSVPLKGGKP